MSPQGQQAYNIAPKRIKSILRGTQRHSGGIFTPSQKLSHNSHFRCVIFCIGENLLAYPPNAPRGRCSAEAGCLLLM